MKVLRSKLKRSADKFQSIAVAVALLALANPVVAAPVTTPTGLNNGDQYRLVFITGSATTAVSGNIADYNTFVTTVANTEPLLVALGTTWTAIGSTSTVDARDNTGTNPSSTGVPIYLVDGTTKIADNNADLWDGTIDSAINISQSGANLSGLSPLTGTNSSGTKSTAVNANELGAQAVAAGSSSATTSGWILASGLANFSPNPMYAISGILIVSGVVSPTPSETATETPTETPTTTPTATSTTTPTSTSTATETATATSTATVTSTATATATPSVTTTPTSTATATQTATATSTRTATTTATTSPTATTTATATETATRTPSSTPSQTPTFAPVENAGGDAACDDDVDNDNDSLLDCSDPDCVAIPPCSSTVPAASTGGTAALAGVLGIAAAYLLARSRVQPAARRG